MKSIKKTTKSENKTRQKKSWLEKLNDDTKKIEIKKLEKEYAGMPAGSTMLIATPVIIDEYIRNIPSGKESTIPHMRNDLAIAHHADFTCPLTTGIFLRIVAEAAHQQYQKGVALSRVTPFWRILDEKSPLNNKLSFGADFVPRQRKKERITSSLNQSAKSVKSVNQRKTNIH